MVIQRWQSVWLLVASICVALFCFLPMATLTFEAQAAPTVTEEAANSVTFIQLLDMNPVLFIVGLLVALLLLLNIFSFKDTKRQKKMTILSIILIAVLGCCAVFMVYNNQSETAHIEWLGSCLLLLGAVAFALLAYRGIRNDEKLLRAADRIR